MNARGQSSIEGNAEFSETYGARAREALERSILPFWQRTLDETRGGVFNCWNNTGTRLVSTDKFTWSQGRFVWLWSRLADLAARGRLTGSPRAFLQHAEKTVRFLQAHAFLEDGQCAFVLTAEGIAKEPFPGSGLAPSIYADCFVAMGFAEFARVSGDYAVFDTAWKLAEGIERRIAAGGFPTMPEPIPDGYESHAVAMITLNVALVLQEAAQQLGDRRAGAARERTRWAAGRIFDTFLLPGGRIAELLPRGGSDDRTLLSRHLNPGHGLEGLWMLLTVARREKRADWITRALEAVRFTLERGWDDAQGGILHYVDWQGGEPKGTPGSSAYEAGVRATWDTKLWWVHSEALYTTALSANDGPDIRAWFERIWEYALQVFPQPDPAVGEWIQIRNRRGEPLDRVVALPVKDPYHIARNLIQLVELFSVRGSAPGEFLR